MSFYSSRPERLGSYIVEHNATVRDTAKKFSVSKSTVHTDVTDKLKTINAGLYAKVRAVLEINKRERHIRGGIATKEKYRKIRESEENE